MYYTVLPSIIVYTLLCTTLYCTLHSALYTLHSTLYTIHYSLYTIYSTLYTIHSKLYTLHSTSLHCPVLLARSLMTFRETKHGQMGDKAVCTLTQKYTLVQCSVEYHSLVQCRVSYPSVVYHSWAQTSRAQCSVVQLCWYQCRADQCSGLTVLRSVDLLLQRWQKLNQKPMVQPAGCLLQEKITYSMVFRWMNVRIAKLMNLVDTNSKYFN